MLRESKKLKAECKRISDRRKETGEGRYPEWDYFDAIDAVLGHKPSTEPAVVIDMLEETQVQEWPGEDDDQEILETELLKTWGNSDTSGTAIPSPASTDRATDTSTKIPGTSLTHKQAAVGGNDKMVNSKNGKGRN